METGTVLFISMTIFTFCILWGCVCGIFIFGTKWTTQKCIIMGSLLNAVITFLISRNFIDMIGR